MEKKNKALQEAEEAPRLAFFESHKTAATTTIIMGNSEGLATYSSH